MAGSGFEMSVSTERPCVREAVSQAVRVYKSHIKLTIYLLTSEAEAPKSWSWSTDLVMAASTVSGTETLTADKTSFDKNS